MFLKSFSATVYIIDQCEVLFFTISKGLRQRRTLPPKLFSVYMDDLFKLLITSRLVLLVLLTTIADVF